MLKNHYIMKTKFLTYLLFLTFVVSSCGKDGAIGPEGEKGEQGPKGDQGIPGKDGSTILSGTSNPNSSIGKEGDFYLNLNTGGLFGPKTSTGWGTPYNMKGPKGDTGSNGTDGTDGKDGATILNGKTVPTKTQGKPGDFYINTSDFTIYGPKKSNGDWGTGVNLININKTGIIIYGVYPTFDVDLKSQAVEGRGYHITAKSKIYNLSFDNDRILDFYYANVGRLVEVSYLDNVWEKYVRQLNFSSIPIGIDTEIYDVKIGTTVMGVDDGKDSYNVQYTIDYYSYYNTPLYLTTSGIYFQIRATPLEGMKYLSSKPDRENVYKIIAIK